MTAHPYFYGLVLVLGQERLRLGMKGWLWMAFSILTGEQIRAGRALARIEQAELAHMAGVSLETIKRLERFRGPVEATTRTVASICSAFYASGVVFDLGEGSGPGLRLLSMTPWS